MTSTTEKRYPRIEAILKKEMEGGLYAHIWMRYAFGKYMCCRDLYTVKEGKVYCVEPDGTLYLTEDTLFGLQKDCHRIGKYNP